MESEGRRVALILGFACAKRAHQLRPDLDADFLPDIMCAFADVWEVVSGTDDNPLKALDEWFELEEAVAR